MPRLNRYGQALSSPYPDGAGTVSVDRIAILPAAGQACWLEDELVIANAQVEGIWRVVAIPSAGGIRLVLDPAGSNRIVAGGGRWLGWSAGRGMFGTLGERPSAGVLAAGPDGTLAWCLDYQTGMGFVLTAPGGSETFVPDAFVHDIQVLGPTSAIWWDFRGGWMAVGTEDVRPALPAGRLRVATVARERWLVYWSEGTGLIAQVDGANDGYILERRPIAFNHDAAAVPVLNETDALLVVAWSLTQGEAPHDLVWLIVDKTAPRQRLESAGGGTLPPTPLPDGPGRPVPAPVPTPPAPDPDIQPPAPEPPAAAYSALTPYEVAMTEQGWLIGPGDHVVSIDAAGHVTFGRTELTDADLLELTRPDDRYQFRSIAHDLILGADATQHTPTGNVCQQLYAISKDRRGNYESWSVGQWDGSALVTAVIFYDRQGADNGRSWTSASLTWVKK